MMMHMPWVLVALMVFLVLVVLGSLASARGRWPLIAILVGTLLLVLAAVGAWASHQGYIVITSVACTDEGYRAHTLV